VEDELKCPITMSRMRDAVVTCDGHSYERSAILRWLRRLQPPVLFSFTSSM
ncbi:hypothetical protein GUITHDRAFT_75270, partial [Guillardia theta CCMP2712]